MLGGLRVAVGMGRWRLASGALVTATVPAFADPPPAPPPRVPPAVMARIDGRLMDHFYRCWTWSGPASGDYVPMVHISFAADGRPVGEPKLYGAPFGPDQYKVAAYLLQALRGCGPLRVTPEMARHA